MVVPMTDGFFNSHQVRIERFVQRLIRPGDGAQAAAFEYEITLALGEATGTRFAVERITLEVTGASIEPLTQHDVTRMFLDAVMRGIEREKAGTRPGSP
jgi:hypothetical protein